MDNSEDKLNIHWSKAPSAVEVAAMDSNGRVFGYVTRPQANYRVGYSLVRRPKPFFRQLTESIRKVLPW